MISAQTFSLLDRKNLLLLLPLVLVFQITFAITETIFVVRDCSACTTNASYIATTVKDSSSFTVAEAHHIETYLLMMITLPFHQE